jgi:hypothetical protein
MARTVRTVSALLTILMIVSFLSTPVWAQTQEEVLAQMAGSMASMAQAMQRLVQTPPTAATTQPAATSIPAGGCDPANCLTREEWNQFLAKDFTSLKNRVGKVESLVGKIAPREVTRHAPAPARQPATTGPVAQTASSGSGLARVKMTPPAQEEFLSIGFAGDVPNQKDVEGVKNLLQSRYELVQVVSLPAPGSSDQERAVRTAARGAALNAAYGSAVSTRKPADNEESRQLAAGAPASTGVVFHLRLKAPAQTASTP